MSGIAVIESVLDEEGVFCEKTRPGNIDDEISGCWPNDPESIPLLEFDVDPFKLLQKQPIALKIDSSTNQSCFTQLQLFYTTLISNI